MIVNKQNEDKINLIKHIGDMLNIGDILVFRKSSKFNLDNILYKIEQIPNVNGGIVAIDATSEKVLALVGGLNFKNSKFNRVTQAKRQAGSAFKPFVYLSGLENGMTPSSLILDLL